MNRQYRGILALACCAQIYSQAMTNAKPKGSVALDQSLMQDESELPATSQASSGAPISFNVQEDSASDELFIRKETIAKEMAEEAVIFFGKKTVAEACNLFIADPKWRKGELDIFVFDRNGVCYTHGTEREVIWQDYYEETDAASKSFIAAMLAQGDRGGWVNYNWNNAVHHAYVKTAQKNGKIYIIGCGFYPQSSRFRTQVLMDDVTAYIKEHGANDAFPRINNTNGIFVRGDIYAVVLDFEGICVADGNDLSLLGQNLLTWQDDENPVNHYRLIIDTAKSAEGKGWITYMKDGAKKIAYVTKVIDPLTQKPYAVSAGYYPEVNEKAVRNLVKKGADYLKRNGRTGIEREFLGKDMRFGSVRLFVYDQSGTALVDAYDPQFIGQNIMWLKDPDGRPIVKLIVDQAMQFDRSWVRYIRRNEYKSTYVEKVSTSEGVFIVGGGYFPASKEEDARSMVTRGVEFIQRNNKEIAFRAFTDAKGDFIHGDIHIFVYDMQGFCIVDGLHRNYIWNNDKKIKDAKGRSVTEVLIATAKSGGGWLEMTLHSALNRVFVKAVEKELPDGTAETFVIASGYYL